MVVNEIFNSIDGEGKRAGELTTFIRFCGCNLKCDYCDTKYSWQNNGIDMTVEQIVDKLKQTGFHNVTITGGEPLIQSRIDKLVCSLLDNGFYVNIETNGTLDPSKVLSTSFSNPNLFITMDDKTKCSGYEQEMKFENFECLTNRDVLKFVVADKQELLSAVHFMHLLESYSTHKDSLPIVYFSPVFGKIEPKEIVEFMKEQNLQKNCRVQLQLHKYIWNPNKRGV